MTDEELTRESIDASHSKGTAAWSGDLVNKGSFLTQVKLFTFFDGELPFEIEGNLNIKTRMPFGKARMILPRPMFDPAFPMISKVEPLRYKNLAYLYTEIRGVNDINNNTSKTAEFLLMHEWVAVIQTSKDSKMYLFPTCSLTHELGITHRNHPQMLHGLFVKFLVNKGTQTSQGYTVEQLYKAGLTRLDKQLTRDKVSVYQIKSEKSEDKRMVNGLETGDIEAAAETSKPISSQSSETASTVISDKAGTMTPDVDTGITTDIRNDNVASTTSGTVLLATANSVSMPGAVGASSNKVLLPTPTTTMLCLHSSATPSTIPAVSTSTVPIVISDSTSTVNVPKATTSVCGLQSNRTVIEECGVIANKEVGVIKSTEPKIGQKRPATDTSCASAPKRTREVLRNNMQQLLEGKGSVSEDETTKTPSQSSNITDVQLDNINVSDEVFQHLESAMSMISSRELHSIIKPLQSTSGGSPAKSQPATSTSGDLGVTVELEDDRLTSSATTVATTTPAVLVDDKTSTVQANVQPQFNVPTVVYDKPCKRPKSILKGGSKIDQLDDASMMMEDSPTAANSTKVPRKIGLAEYKKRYKERRDSEDVAEDVTPNNSATEVAVESSSKDSKKSVDLPSPSPTDHLMIVEEAIESSIDGTATSKANSDVSVSFKEEKKESPSKSESLPVILSSKSQSISKPVKIPHPMSVLASTSSAIIPHKYTDLTLPHYYPNPPFRHEWTTNYPIFSGLSRPYLMPHPPPTAPLPSTILTTAMIPSVPPPPVVFDPLTSVSTQKADEEMARVEDLTEMFTKNLQSKLKHVMHSDDSSRGSSPKPRKSRSLSRSLSPPPRSSRRGRSPRRSRRSTSRSQSLDSCRGSDREQTRSRSKSPRFHKSHRSRRYRSSSRESSVEDRRYSRSSKRNRNDKRRDHKPIVMSKTISTQTEENTYKSGDTKRLSEKESQTDRLLFVHSKSSQTYPMFENHKAVQVDFSGSYSEFYTDFSQYLEMYPLDVFHFDDILANSISYFEQEISKVFPCNQTLSSKKLKKVLEFGYMKELNSQLKNLVKEGQTVDPYMDVYRPGTPLLDDNQPVVNLTSTVPGEGEGEGNEQPIDDESSGLSNSEILSDSEGSIDSLPEVNLKEMLLSQYSNNGKATQESSAETSHATPTKSRPEEPPPKQSNTEPSCKQSIKSDDANKGACKVASETENTSKILIKEETTDLDKSFVPENDKLVESPYCDRMSPSLPSTRVITHDHTYSKNGSHPSGTQLKISSVSKTDGSFLTTIEHRSTNKSSGTRQKASSKRSLPNDFLYQSIRKGCQEYLSSSTRPTGGYEFSDEDVESDHDTIDMEISLTDSQNEEESIGNVSAEEKVDESKSQPSKSSQSSTAEDKNKGTPSITDSKTKGVGHKASGSTKDLHHYTYHTHYQAQPFKYRQQQRPQLYYGAPVRPETYIPWDWRRNYAWGPPRY